eukprot:TRINITY_DN5506_c0_g1_i1.p1 TRINITY_DN5506_c0_g1~~TRINITY_DN5506_c0_g1_i1.p1  ORF type:complete len:659 (+),score=166.85 TRINITY_DN5506_c0_g1_i1:77-2053(+)
MDWANWDTTPNQSSTNQNHVSNDPFGFNVSAAPSNPKPASTNAFPTDFFSSFPNPSNQPIANNTPSKPATSDPWADFSGSSFASKQTTPKPVENVKPNNTRPTSNFDFDSMRESLATHSNDSGFNMHSGFNTIPPSSPMAQDRPTNTVQKLQAKSSPAPALNNSFDAFPMETPTLPSTNGLNSFFQQEDQRVQVQPALKKVEPVSQPTRSKMGSFFGKKEESPSNYSRKAVSEALFEPEELQLPSHSEIFGSIEGELPIPVEEEGMKVLCRVCNTMVDATKLDQHSVDCSVIKEKQQAAPTATGPVLVVTITDAQKKGAALNSWVSYKLATKLTFPGGNMKDTGHVVERRDSDFEWLYQLLIAEYPEVLLPPIPDKSVKDASKQRDFARFIEAVMTHPSLIQSKIIKAFVEVHEEKFRPWQKSIKVENHLNMGMGAKALQMISKDTTGAPKDGRIEKAREFFNNVHKSLTAILTAVEKIQKQQAEVAASYMSMGDAVFMLIADPKNHATIEGPIGQCVKSVSREMTAHINAEEIKMTERIRYWLRYTKEAQNLLARLDTAETNHSFLLGQYKKKKEQFEGLKDIAAQQAFKSKIDESHKAYKIAEHLLQKIKATAFNEFNRFNNEKIEALKDIFGQYAKGQNMFFAKIASNWALIAPI